MVENALEHALSLLIEAGCHVHLREKLTADDKSRHVFSCKVTSVDTGMWFGEGQTLIAAIVACLKQMTFSLEVSRFEIQKLADNNRKLIDAVKTTTGEKTNG